MDDARKCERLCILKREVRRGKGRKMLMWIGLNRDTKGWAERDGKEGTQSERDGAGESEGNTEKWRK